MNEEIILKTLKIFFIMLFVAGWMMLSAFVCDTAPIQMIGMVIMLMSVVGMVLTD